MQDAAPQRKKPEEHARESAVGKAVEYIQRCSDTLIDLCETQAQTKKFAYPKFEVIKETISELTDTLKSRWLSRPYPFGYLYHEFELCKGVQEAIDQLYELPKVEPGRVDALWDSWYEEFNELYHTFKIKLNDKKERTCVQCKRNGKCNEIKKCKDASIRLSLIKLVQIINQGRINHIKSLFINWHYHHKIQTDLDDKDQDWHQHDQMKSHYMEKTQDSIKAYFRGFKNFWQPNLDIESGNDLIMIGGELRLFLFNCIQLQHPDFQKLANFYLREAKSARKVFRNRTDNNGVSIYAMMSYEAGGIYLNLAKNAKDEGQWQKARYLMTIAMGHFHSVKDQETNQLELALMEGRQFMLDIEIKYKNIKQIIKHVTKLFGNIRQLEKMALSDRDHKGKTPVAKLHELDYASIVQGLDEIIKYYSAHQAFSKTHYWQNIKNNFLANEKFFKETPSAAQKERSQRIQEAYKEKHKQHVKTLFLEHEFEFNGESSKDCHATVHVSPELWRKLDKRGVIKKLIKSKALQFQNDKIVFTNLLAISHKHFGKLVERLEAGRMKLASLASRAHTDDVVEPMQRLSLAQAMPSSGPEATVKAPKIKTRGTPKPILFKARSTSAPLHKGLTVASKGFDIQAPCAEMGLAKDTPIQQCRDPFGGKNPYYIVYLEHGTTQVSHKVVRRFQSSVFSNPKLVKRGQGIKIWSDSEGHLMPVGKLKGRGGQGKIRALPQAMLENDQGEMLFVYTKKSFENTKSGKGHAHHGRKRS